MAPLALPDGSAHTSPMKRLKKKKFGQAYEPLEDELVAMARWVAKTGARVVVLFEGRDTAGKGGSIQAVAGPLNPRQCKVVALPKPTEAEKTQWYFQRYVAHLPAAGEIVLFDRSWYNRAGVEKVMGFATDSQVNAFLKQAPVFEKMLVDDGVLLFKYWLCTDQAQQEERFRERLDDPLKRWKLSPIDTAARQSYDQYTKAREAMLRPVYQGARSHAHGNPYQGGPLDAGRFQRPASRPAYPGARSA